LGGDPMAFFHSGSDESAAGEVIRPAEERPKALMDGGDGLFGE